MTAVEYLINALLGEHINVWEAEVKTALEMEKKQMDKVAGDWWIEGANYMCNIKRKYESFDEYYAVTFKKGTDL